DKRLFLVLSSGGSRVAAGTNEALFVPGGANETWSPADYQSFLFTPSPLILRVVPSPLPPPPPLPPLLLRSLTSAVGTTARTERRRANKEKKKI
ncbi:hypothetical protein V1478_013838, partial [Vespula squamosa]